MKSSAIGLFDSGLGGLTVLKELKSILPNENYIYFGDTARVPYGSKSKEVIIEYSKQICDFLEKQNVKIIIIACGTASSQAYEYLSKHSNIPIINVITPTAKNIKGKNISVIATNGTIKSNAWKKEIIKYAKEPKKITQKACPLFVPIVEEGLQKTTIANEAIKMYLSSIKKSKADTLVLGCTHYPLLIDEIKTFFDNKINIINTGTFCAKETKDYLKKHKLLNDSKSRHYTYAYTTDNPSLFNQNASKFCDIKFDKVNKVSF